ncbi:MAG TPA: hypothetical protein VIU11_15910 [Nakamurella sp.]
MLDSEIHVGSILRLLVWMWVGAVSRTRAGSRVPPGGLVGEIHMGSFLRLLV